jgi:tetratricopeptide (TPR) repeat protein
VGVSDGDWLFTSVSEEAEDPKLALAREFRTLATAQHPNVINVLDYGFRPDGQPFFTMALLENARPITQAAADAPIDYVIGLLIQLLQGVTYLHRRGILHRDLKPANVLVANDVVKIVDFGLSADRREASRTAGTLAYMAPELIVGGPATEASDLYALGIIAIEMFSGGYPFSMDDIGPLVDQILAGNPTFQITDPRVDERIVAILHRLTRRSPEERHISLKELYAIYEDLTGHPYKYLSATTRDSYLQAAKLVGRESEIATFQAALQCLDQGIGAGWLVAGESGVGKSRLIDEVRTLALIHGVAVLKGQTRSESNRLYEVWREPLANLVLRGTLTDSEASILKPYLPNIEQILGRAVEMPPTLAPQAFQMRFFEVVLGLLEQDDRPLLIILDDLQWITRESLALLNFVLPITRTKPIIVIGTFRDDEAPGLPAKLPLLQVMKLNRLVPDEIAALTESMFGSQALAPNLLGFIGKETEGNVFFIVEVVRALAELSGGLAEIGTRTLPASLLTGGVRQVIERRFARVPKAMIGLLNIAAVSGRALDLALLERFRPPDIALEDWLQECTDAAILERSGAVWRFAHDKLREALINGLSEGRKALVNEQIAEAIEALYPDDPSQFVALYNHWRHSGNLAKTAHYAALAAEQLVNEYAFEDAERCLQRALEIAPQVGTPPHAQAALYRLLGITRRQFSDRLADYGRALELMQWPIPPLDNRSALPRVGLAMMRQFAIHRVIPPTWYQARSRNEEIHIVARLHQEISGDFWNEQKHLASGALYVIAALNLAERAGFKTATLARANAGAAAGLGSALGWHRIARHYARKAVAIAESLNDPATLAYVLNAVGFNLSYTGQWDEARRTFERAIQISAGIGDHDALASAYINLAELYINQGDISEALRVIEPYLRQTRVERLQKIAYAYLVIDYAHALLLSGRVDDAAAQVGSLARDTTLSVSRRLSAGAILIQEQLALEHVAEAQTLLREFATLGQRHNQGLEELAECAVQLTALAPNPALAAEFLKIAAAGLEAARRSSTGILVARPGWRRLRGDVAWIKGAQRRAYADWNRGLTLARQMQMGLEESRLMFTIAAHRPTHHPARQAELHAAEAGFVKAGAAAFLPQVRVLLSGDSLPVDGRPESK